MEPDPRDPLLPTERAVPPPPPSAVGDALTSLVASHVLWVYVAVIAVALARSLLFGFLAVLVFLLHIATLHVLLARNRAPPSAQPKLRGRFLATAALGPPLQFLVGVFFFSVAAYATMHALGLYPKIDDTTPAGAQQRAEDFRRRLEAFVKEGNPLTKLAILVGVALILGSIQAATTRILPMGYLTLLSNVTQAGLRVREPTVKDVVDYSAVGALGVLVGRTIFILLFVSLAARAYPSMPLPYLGTSIAVLFSIMTEQVYVALAVAERDVLAREWAVPMAVVVVWGVDGLLSFLSMLNGAFLPVPVWVERFSAPALIVIVLAGFIAVCWKRYREAFADEDARNRMRDGPPVFAEAVVGAPV